MRFMTWDESYSVNVAEIDAQHMKLFEMLSDFYDAMKTNSKEALGRLLNSAADYTHYHFGTEEKYFDKFKYSKAEAHKKAHQTFVGKVKDVKTRFESGELVLSLEATNFLKDWLINHIKVSDKEYSRCFNDNGLK